MSRFAPASRLAGKVCRIRGVVFDKDGTLIDYWAYWAPLLEGVASLLAAEGAWHREAFRRALGLDADGRLVASGPLAGGTTEECVVRLDRALREAGLPALRRRALLATVRRMLTDRTQAQLRTLADLHALVAGLHERGLRVGVVSNDDHDRTVADLEELGLLAHLDFVRGYRPGLRPKPAPDAVLDFCCRFDLRPVQVAVVGDTPVDMELAWRAGAGLRCGVLSGVGDRAALAPLADVVLDSVAQLLPLLEEPDGFTCP